MLSVFYTDLASLGLYCERPRVKYFPIQTSHSFILRFLYYRFEHRTARGDKVGTALSFITGKDESVLEAAKLALAKSGRM